MWVASTSRTVYVLGEHGMESRVVCGGGLDISEGTLLRDGKRYMFVGSRGPVEIDTARARLMYREIVACREHRRAPIGKPALRKVGATQEEQELVLRITHQRRLFPRKTIEWQDTVEHERRCRELRDVDTNIEGAFILQFYR